MENRVKYIPLGLLVLHGAKSLVQGLSWESVAASLVFAGLWYLLEYKSNDKKLQVLSVRMAELEKAHKDTEVLLGDFRSSISALRMTNGLKQQTTARNAFGG